MLNRPSEIEVDDFTNFTNRPMTLELDSNEFNSFLGKKATARRQARRDAKNELSQISEEEENVKGTSLKTLLSRAKNRKNPALKTDKMESDVTTQTSDVTTQTSDVSSKSTDATTDESSTGFTSKKGLLIGAGVVALIAGYWFFVRKKK
jgi:LPXTG-motif cell wall-anchored protein